MAATDPLYLKPPDDEDLAAALSAWREGRLQHELVPGSSTLLNEQGVHPDLIELQLAHVERNTGRHFWRWQRLAAAVDYRSNAP